MDQGKSEGKGKSKSRANQTVQKVLHMVLEVLGLVHNVQIVEMVLMHIQFNLYLARFV